ncbi:hypothetical protein AOQ73_25195 [Bradyrhizobium pachyrhizi]|nr:hypothetical protein AOQ73_25195 [Bradyrhizobium pachyrhizi]
MTRAGGGFCAARCTFAFSDRGSSRALSARAVATRMPSVSATDPSAAPTNATDRTTPARGLFRMAG